MTHRVHNFGPGPAAMPLAVLEEAQRDLLDHRGSGMSILETSHRSERYAEIHHGAIADLKALLGAGESHRVLFMTGGAVTQFSLAPMNLLPAGGHAEYLTTGRWSEMALAAARRAGDAREIWSSAATGHDRVPGADDARPGAGAAYLHYTSNNTIYGTQYREHPGGGGVPLACDMSSDFLSRPLPIERFGLIYAGAQKNAGPAGVTVVVIREDLLARSAEADLPGTFSYARMAEKSSLLNTPPVFAIYLVGLVARALLAGGGLAAAAERSTRKAELLYAAIDGSEGFYRGHARPGSRSLMNVTFRLPAEELETAFLRAAADQALVGLKGHRSVGGIRASIYNAVELDSVRLLAELMRDFAARHA